MKSKIFVINLDRSPQRLEDMAKQFEDLGLGFERVSAVDGKNLSEGEIGRFYSKELNRKHYFVSLSKNEIACYQSHLKACKKIIDDNLDYAVILEDDVILCDGFKYIIEIINAIKEPWGCLKLINFKNKKKVVEVKKINLEGIMGIGDFKLVKWNKVPILAAAYAITRESAEKFIKAYPKCYRPVDVDFQYPWEHKIDMLGIAPNLVKMDESKDSTIVHTKLKRHYPLARIVYKLKYIISTIIRKK